MLNWGDYIDPALLQQFEKETGISVKYTTMTSNEEMLVKLSSPDCIYDVCFPSDYIIEKLIADDLLYAINKENIPNIKNIDPRFLNLSFDPDNTYSVPYMWGHGRHSLQHQDGVLAHRQLVGALGRSVFRRNPDVRQHARYDRHHPQDAR